MEQDFSAVLYPRISYGIEIYGRTSISNLKKLQIIQNKSLKILLNLHPRTPTDFVHNKAKVLKIHHIYDYTTLIFVYKQINGKLPSIYDNYFTPNHHIHQHYTRQSSNLHVPQIHSKHGHNMTKFTGPQMWNKLPPELRQQNNIIRFKHLLKQYFLASYVK